MKIVVVILYMLIVDIVDNLFCRVISTAVKNSG